jgi:hypothetical protein
MIFTLVLISTISADLIINPDNKEINMKFNQATNFSLSLKNTFDYKITDIEFTNLTNIGSMNKIDLNPNETKVITINLNPTTAGYREINSIVTFNYLVDLPTGTRTSEVNITDNGYYPNYKVIRKGDTIKWSNRDDITHSVTGASFDQDIPVNGSFQYTFNSVGEFNYQDLIMFFGGTIKVINSTEPEKVHDPSLDKLFNLKLDVRLDNTTLQINNNNQNYTIEAMGQQQGFLDIKNIGNEVAQRVIISDSLNWLSYDSNSFDLTKNTNNLVKYTISPLILSTNETNKTYNIELKIKGSNTNEYKINLNIFIPYNNNFADPNTAEGFLANYQNFCRANPNYLLCNNTIQQTNSSQIIIRDPTLNFNLSTRDFLAVTKRIQVIQDTVERDSNARRDKESLNDARLDAIERNVNQSLQMQIDNRNDIESKTRAFWIIVIFGIIVGIIIYVSIKIRKYNSTKNMTEEGYLKFS